ncbi:MULTISPECIES: hypothetical protein [unclassified Burkholderia]|uniref:hypothetical protein n=1 Tax=unclassified Burkholderia TaxID=2613784 RepID=UPI000F5799DB|nr:MULTISPECIES: hypothetical protein [unclassified Burkholderia]RQR26302.1 hypothetical protein DIE22_33445 [Burkholderia sp. Bp9142]RQR43989.1 hypothetical protein DIE21_34550 [Burkholderia sp. Bp9140]
MKAATLIALTCLALTACGGGDDNASPAASGGGTSDNGGSGGAGGSGSGGTGGSGGSTLTWRYDAQTPAADGPGFLTLLNSEGAKGYRYLGDYYYDAASGGTRSIFVNDGTAQTYTYQLQSPPADWAGFLGQANGQGANGYRYEGPYGYGYLYRKDGGSSATYTYTTTGLPADPNAFLTQANAQGQSGYWFFSAMVVGSVQANVYMKNNASNATYTYDALTPAASINDFIAQSNSEGAKGYRAKGGQVFGSTMSWIYVKDQMQSSTFTYQSAATQSTGANFVQQANDYGAQGNAYLGELAFSAPPPAAMQQAPFYFKAGNCTGFLCTTLNPLTQN